MISGTIRLAAHFHQGDMMAARPNITFYGFFDASLATYLC